MSDLIMYPSIPPSLRPLAEKNILSSMSRGPWALGGFSHAWITYTRRCPWGYLAWCPDHLSWVLLMLKSCDSIPVLSSMTGLTLFWRTSLSTLKRKLLSSPRIFSHSSSLPTDCNLKWEQELGSSLLRSHPYRICTSADAALICLSVS